MIHRQFVVRIYVMSDDYAVNIYLRTMYISTL